MNGYHHGKPCEREEMPAYGLLLPSKDFPLFLLHNDGTRMSVILACDTVDLVAVLYGRGCLGCSRS